MQQFKIGNRVIKKKKARKKKRVNADERQSNEFGKFLLNH